MWEGSSNKKLENYFKIMGPALFTALPANPRDLREVSLCTFKLSLDELFSSTPRETMQSRINSTAWVLTHCPTRSLVDRDGNKGGVRYLP